MIVAVDPEHYALSTQSYAKMVEMVEMAKLVSIVVDRGCTYPQTWD
jgi:hypothetical protein